MKITNCPFCNESVHDAHLLYDLCGCPQLLTDKPLTHHWPLRYEFRCLNCGTFDIGFDYLKEERELFQKKQKAIAILNKKANNEKKTILWLNKPLEDSICNYSPIQKESMMGN